MRIYIAGGSKSGKSMLAQKLACLQGRPLYYIATMQPSDKEDDLRILRHRQERAGMGFATIEHPRNITQLLHRCNPKGSFLLDSVTALLANELFADGTIHPKAGEKIATELCQLLRQIPNFVAVSDNIFSDAVVYDQATENYRRALGQIGCRVACECDVLLEVSAGMVTAHKGKKEWRQLEAMV